MKRKEPTLTVHDPEIEALMRDFYEKFGKYALPDEETRRMIDRELGERSLSGELLQMRVE